MDKQQVPLRTWMFLVAGGIVGALAAVLFLTMHAILLVPIWFALARAVATGAIGGAGIGYAFGVLAASDLSRPSVRRGAAFGAYLWLALLPPSVVELTLKTVSPNIADPIDVALVLASLVLPPAAAAWSYRRARRAVATAIVAVIGLFVLTGGPLGPLQFRRGVSLVAGLLPIFSIAGVCLAAILRALSGLPGEVSARAV
jgi:hypothetical protein